MKPGKIHADIAWAVTLNGEIGPVLWAVADTFLYGLFQQNYAELFFFMLRAQICFFAI